ncbi:TPA: CPBP family intramembrane metalloprotease [Streptococcus suis]|nr:CPBP family intramembrane metalloprotease [Streptococcus suis]
MALPKKETLVFLFFYTFTFLLNGYQLLPRAVWGPFQLAAYVLLALIGLYVWRRELAGKLSWIVQHKWRSCLILLLGYVLAICCDGVFSLFLGYLQELAGGTVAMTNEGNMGKILQLYPAWMIIPILGILGPIVEELFYRQFLASYLEDRFGRAVAIGLSGLLFAASHLHSWELREVIGLLGYLGSGLVYSGLFLKTNRNIYFSSILHIFGNSSLLLIYYLQ